MKSIGSLVEAARAGGDLPNRHHNPYVHEALELGSFLLTPSQIQEEGGYAPDRCFTKASPAAPFFVEVGTYMGKNLIEMATERPDARFMGLDITYKRTVKTARKIKNLGLDNAAVGLCDARTFFSALTPRSTAGVCVFFPDPWPKKRHVKNRLVRAPFLEQLERALIPDGFLWLKTDSEDYYRQALEDALARGWSETTENTPREFGGKDYKTVFESLFERKGEPTHGAVLRYKSEAQLSEFSANRNTASIDMRKRGNVQTDTCFEGD